MMQRLLFISFLFFLFIIEGTLFQWVVPDVWGTDWTFIPLLSLCAVMMVSIYFGPNHGVVYGFFFGLIHDITFGHMIGSYLFSFAAVAYFSGHFIRQYNPHNVVVIITISIGIAVQIMMVYGLYKLFNVTQMSVQWMFYKLLLPSMAVNTLFAILLLRPIKRWIRRMGARIEEYGSY